MTRVGWLADEAGYVGGAELTTAEFRALAPEGVEIVDCPPGKLDLTCDRFVIQNCVLYSAEELSKIPADRPVFKYWHDVGPHLQPGGVRGWLYEHAKHICCSPVQAEYMDLTDAVCIPPPVDLARFEAAAAEVNGSRSGAVSVGQWRNYGKAPHRAAEWAEAHGGIDFFGAGVFAPRGSQEVAYDDMPALLARYSTFVHLPIVIEPFGRLVAEAWAAGCEIVTNNLVGAKWWITESPDALYTAGEDFWRTVLA
jgi:hypothetical protein